MDRPKTEMSKAERAALLEKQHLKECEESDYQMLEGLFTARASIDDTDDSYEVNKNSAEIVGFYGDTLCKELILLDPDFLGGVT